MRKLISLMYFSITVGLFLTLFPLSSSAAGSLYFRVSGDNLTPITDGVLRLASSDRDNRFSSLDFFLKEEGIDHLFRISVSPMILRPSDFRPEVFSLKGTGTIYCQDIGVGFGPNITEVPGMVVYYPGDGWARPSISLHFTYKGFSYIVNVNQIN